MSDTGLKLPSSWNPEGSDWWYPEEIVNVGSSHPTQVEGSLGEGDEILVSLSWNGGTNFTSTKTTGALNYWGDDKTLGGSTDTWGRSWSYTEFSNTNFRVRIESTYPKYHQFWDFSFNIPSSSTINGIEVELTGCGSDFGQVTIQDTLKIKVYYTDNSTPVVGQKYALPPFRRS